MANDHAHLELGGDAAQDARDAATLLVAELQAGWETHDAEVSNRHFADDIVWGSPFGATVRGYDDLHAIHVRLKAQGRGGAASRFELVQLLAPAPDVAIAQVQRVALDADGAAVEPTDDKNRPFSEMVLFVLVRRDATWWVAAGQNTLIRPPPTG